MRTRLPATCASLALLPGCWGPTLSACCCHPSTAGNCAGLSGGAFFNATAGVKVPIRDGSIVLIKAATQVRLPRARLPVCRGG